MSTKELARFATTANTCFSMKSSCCNTSVYRLAWALCLAAASAADLPTEDPLRLDPRIRPITQSLNLQLDPASDGYTGNTRVELRFDVATNR